MKFKEYKCDKCGYTKPQETKPLPYRQCRNPFIVCNGTMKLVREVKL